MSDYIAPRMILPAHIEGGKLFADRASMVREIAPKNTTNIAEIGVALGDFSVHIVECCQPKVFHAFDTFDMHLWPEHWGRSSAELFGESSHLETFVNRMSSQNCELETYQGLSSQTLPQCDVEFDFVYVDGAHDYENVVGDAQQLVANVGPGGIVIFNDYTHWDHFIGSRYGVVQAVNEVVNKGLYRIVGFALEKNGFHDIALQRV